MQQVNLLIVDDIPTNIQVLGNILRPLNYDVSYALSGQEALDMCSHRDFDLVLLDIMLPDMDGYQVCGQLRQTKTSAELPVIFLTARNALEDVVRGFDAGGQDYIVKPFNTKELIARIQTHVDLKLHRQELAELNVSLDRKIQERTIQLRAANQRLSRLEQAKSSFLALISHELRTPLHGITGFTQILKKVVTDQVQLEYLEFIMDSAKRLIKFADSATLITSLQTSSYKLQQQSYDLVDDTRALIRFVEKKSDGVIIELLLDQPQMIVKADAALVRKCMEIVIENAMQYTPKEKPITIHLQQQPKLFNIVVQDQGPGFSASSLQQVYEMFASDNYWHHKEGFGLGLAAANLIMKTLGGMIEIKHPPVGGAMVSLTISK